ncbi:hypothetical protein [Nonomuraea aurantiaca]|uniref:hypothetical protein n=1 Tax=Nonomuraea aurantiaca TaxID=2878562 RepID=UPI001CD99C3A|nr:hypothetical protein [Nonomuraea aurantiaca]MCA2223879.1 hypothetical protein [Nonomuraea aurantiaca]
MTTLQELEIRVTRLEERSDNQREDIKVIGSEVSKILLTQDEILKVQRTHTSKIDALDEKLNELATVVGGHSQTLAGHSQTLAGHSKTLAGHTQTLAEHSKTLAKHTRMFETLFAHFGIPLPAEDPQHN